jgi:bifunctional non-homologous end joining protein LigD
MTHRESNLRKTIVEVQGRRLEISNLDKVLYPAAGFTKKDVIDYYTGVGPVMLPHLRGRTLTLKRYPNGVEGESFYEKNCPKARPEWVETAPIWSEGNHRWMEYCVAQNLGTLVWAANLAALELHTSLSMASAMPHPSFVVFDLDPGAPAGMVQCCRVGLWIHDALTRRGLRSFAKTSGSKGLQVYLPVNSGINYDESKPFAHQLALTLERKHPELVVSDMQKPLREGKVLVDWSQNDAHKTTVCVYSLRARPQPTVSTPVSWAEVSRCLESGDAAALEFTAAQVLQRVERYGDLFAPVLSLCQQLPSDVGTAVVRKIPPAKVGIGQMRSTGRARQST